MNTKKMIAAVAIGRNEGERLVACLRSLVGQVDRIIYVDSGSTDGSVSAAKAHGAKVISLDTTVPFTAARARNAGLRALDDLPASSYVQFVDGDCEIRPDWVAKATDFLDCHSDAAVVCGRRRERHPDSSLYNRLIDLEWNTPIGQARACGGDALMRISVLRTLGGYNPDLIAGEEPELCVRIRDAGWTVHRIDAEMTLHDANMTRFRQWWRRSERAGHAYAEGAALHGRSPERHNVAQTRRALFWGLGIPGLALLGGIVSPWGLLILLAWPVQVLRLWLRSNDLAQAFFLTLGKIPEALGVLRYLQRRIAGGPRSLIEYK